MPQFSFDYYLSMIIYDRWGPAAALTRYSQLSVLEMRIAAGLCECLETDRTKRQQQIFIFIGQDKVKWKNI